MSDKSYYRDLQDTGTLVREMTVSARAATRAAMRKSSADYLIERTATRRYLGLAVKSRPGAGAIRMQHSDGSADLVGDDGRAYIVPTAVVAEVFAWGLKPGGRISFEADEELDIVIRIVAKL
jgi:hypothetical protein